MGRRLAVVPTPAGPCEGVWLTLIADGCGHEPVHRSLPAIQLSPRPDPTAKPIGSGRINAYNASTGDFEGTLEGSNASDVDRRPVWPAFGNGVAGTPMTLFFNAGHGGERHGLLGTLTAAPDD